MDNPQVARWVVWVRKSLPSRYPIGYLLSPHDIPLCPQYIRIIRMLDIIPNNGYPYSMSNTTHATYIRRRIVVATIAIVLVSYLIGKSFDAKYAYSCPTMSVAVERGDTLSGITERYCKGYTLQASWDIAELLDTTTIHIGDTIQLGDR